MAALAPSSAASNDTGLFGFQARYLGYLKGDVTACLIALEGGKVSVDELRNTFKPIDLSEPIIAESVLERSENYNNCWTLCYSKTSRKGLWIAHSDSDEIVRGIWEVSGGEMAWATALQFDLICILGANKENTHELKLDCLK